MGSLVSKIDPTQYQVTLLGLDGAGKTTFMQQLKDMFVPKETIPTQPTIGCNIADYNVAHRNIQAWDLGGQDITRRVWLKYAEATSMLVYVVDANDKRRWAAAANSLCSLLLEDFNTIRPDKNEKGLGNVPILLLYNKMDIVKDEVDVVVDAIDKVFVEALRGLYRDNVLLPRHEIHRVSCSFLNGWGHFAIIKTMAYYLYKYHSSMVIWLLAGRYYSEPSRVSKLIMSIDSPSRGLV